MQLGQALQQHADEPRPQPTEGGLHGVRLEDGVHLGLGGLGAHGVALQVLDLRFDGGRARGFAADAAFAQIAARAGGRP